MTIQNLEIETLTGDQLVRFRNDIELRLKWNKRQAALLTQKHIINKLKEGNELLSNRFPIRIESYENAITEYKEDLFNIEKFMGL